MQFRTIDTHQAIKHLVTTGLSEASAEAITGIISDSREYDLSHLTTKEDLSKEVSQAKIDLIKWMISLQIITITFLCGVIGIATAAILKVVIK